jgi:uncharacterized damage-inducible protein DinB
MPIASQLAGAAVTYQINTGMVEKCFSGLTLEELQQRPGEHSNSLLWIGGHLVWARSRALQFLGQPWELPWFPLFARGAKPDDAAQYPSPDEILTAWRDSSASLAAALDTASEETLSAPAPVNPPGSDGKIGGLVNFLAWHETYHVGQAAYLRKWLGHESISG